MILLPRNLFENDNNDHTRWSVYSNKYVPSVTSVIKVISKDSLIYWANSLGWKRKSVQAELDESSRIGTTAHNIVESIINGDDIDTLIDPFLDTGVINAVNSFKQWWKKNKDDIKVLSTEETLISDEYCGTIDFVCKYKGKLTIIDFKTSGDFYYSQYLQLAAYANMYAYCKDKKVHDVGILRLDKKRGNEAELRMLSDINKGDIEYYQYTFMKALELYKCIHYLDKTFKKSKEK